MIGCTESCQNDNFQCSQWWKFNQNEDITVSVNIKSILHDKQKLGKLWDFDFLQGANQILEQSIWSKMRQTSLYFHSCGHV